MGVRIVNGSEDMYKGNMHRYESPRIDLIDMITMNIIIYEIVISKILSYRKQQLYKQSKFGSVIVPVPVLVQLIISLIGNYTHYNK